MKTATQHTPGPWTDDTVGHHLGDAQTVIVRTTGNVHEQKILATCQRKITGLKEAKANARLIAAAPDTYAVCKMLIEGKVSYQELLTSAISAIARAEGNGEG